MLTRIKKALQEALFPTRCQACGIFFHDKNNDKQQMTASASDHFRQTPMELVFQKEMTSFLCPDCVMQFTPVTPPFCVQCGRMFASRMVDTHQCGDCIKKERHYHSARSAGVFSGAYMEIIHRFKYSGKIQLALPLGRLLFTAFIKYFNDVVIDTMIPVPLHISRLKHRGFNQALLLLRQWPDLVRETSGADIRIDFQGEMLHRKKKTESQTGLGKEKRRSNVKAAFEVSNPELIEGKNILLVDDVYTTGATTEECAKILMARGAHKVHALTLARVE